MIVASNNITLSNVNDGSTPYVHIAYATSADGKTGFSTTVSAGKTYIGQYTDYAQADSTDPTKYAWTLIKGDPGAPGPKGDPGNGIRSVTVTYGVSSSAATQPISWSGTVPSVAAGQYLWTRTIIDYTDPATADTVAYTYALQGKTGATGAKGDTGAAGTSVKVSSIQYQAGASATTAPTGTWSNAVVSAAEGQYLWTKTTFSDGTIAYGVAKQGAKGATGATGATGPKGETGAQGVGVSKVTPEYYLSTSNTAQSGGSWAETPAEYVEGRYYWTRAKTTYSDGTTRYSTAVLDNELNDVRDTTDNLQDQQNKTSDSIKTMADDASALKDRVNQNEQNIAAQGDTITNDLVTKTDFNQKTDNLSANVTTLQSVTNAQGTTLKEISESLVFDKNGLTLTDSSSDEKSKTASVNLKGKAMTFRNASGQVVAIFSDEVDIADLTIRQGGTFTMGNFAFIPRSNGNLSIKYIGG